MKEQTLALVHFSLILEEMLEAIKEVHPKQLFFCCSFQEDEDEGRPVCSENRFCLKTAGKRRRPSGSGNSQY